MANLHKIKYLNRNIVFLFLTNYNTEIPNFIYGLNVETHYCKRQISLRFK
jgi:hypothetical protein